MGVLNEKRCKNKKQTLSMHFLLVAFAFQKQLRIKLDLDNTRRIRLSK